MEPVSTSSLGNHNTDSPSQQVQEIIRQCIAVCGRGHFAYCCKLRGARWRGDGLPQEASELPRIIAQIAATCQFSKPNAASELCQMIGKNSILPKSWSVNQRQTAESFPRQNRIRSSSACWLPYYEHKMLFKNLLHFLLKCALCNFMSGSNHFYSDPGIPGLIYGCRSLKLGRGSCWDISDVTLAVRLQSTR